MAHYKDTNNRLHWLDSSNYEHLLPAGSVAITEDEAEALKFVPPPLIPQVVTRFQARVALVQAGYFDTIDTYITTLPKTDVKRLAWEDAVQWERASPTLNFLANMLGLTDTDMDDLFVSASSISA
jgi:hypothetical protein